jgi:hypothetical protein
VQTQPVDDEVGVKTRIVLGKGTPLNLLRLDTTVVISAESLGQRLRDAVVDTLYTLDSPVTRRRSDHVDPKYKATIGEILIEGRSEGQRAHSAQITHDAAGQIFRRAELLKSQRALYESNLFRRAAIEVPKQGDSSKIIVVTVQEARFAKRE